MNMRLGFIYMNTRDSNRLVNFYMRLGLNFKEARHENGVTYYSAEIAGTTFYIYPNELAKIGLPIEKPLGHGTIRFGFDVDNLDDAIKLFPKENVLAAPHTGPWGYLAVIRDPDGNTIYLYQKNKGKIGD